MRVIFVVVLSVVLAPRLCHQQWWTVYHKIVQEPDYSGFAAMIKNNRMAKLNLQYVAVTVFVPDNRAVDDYDGPFLDNLVMYHMGFEVRNLKLLDWNNSLETAYEDNPPLWITTTDNGRYVNNAKIVDDKSDQYGKPKGNQGGRNQVLHVIDRVLDPMMHTVHPKPSAYDFLRHHHKWKIGTRKVNNFLNRIKMYKRERLFEMGGGHTFFVPVDHKMDDFRLRSIDSYIIDGHVVPNVVLFTRPTEDNFVYETAANSNYIDIVVSLKSANGKDYVKSYTVLGNSDHKKGEIVAEIVKGNIPVTNGVVHLISQPLAVFDRELTPFPYLPVFYKISSDPDLNLTYHIGRRNDLNRGLQKNTIYTYFAPKDLAWRPFLHYTKQELGEILKRHIVMSTGRYSMEKLAMLSKNNNGVILESLAGPIRFLVTNDNDTYSITWNNKQIKIYRADYECSDGVVHVMDGVFGVARPPAKKQRHGFWKTLKDLVT